MWLLLWWCCYYLVCLCSEWGLQAMQEWRSWQDHQLLCVSPHSVTQFNKANPLLESVHREVRVWLLHTYVAEILRPPLIENCCVCNAEKTRPLSLTVCSRDLLWTFRDCIVGSPASFQNGWLPACTYISVWLLASFQELVGTLWCSVQEHSSRWHALATMQCYTAEAMLTRTVMAAFYLYGASLSCVLSVRGLEMEDFFEMACRASGVCSLIQLLQHACEMCSLLIDWQVSWVMCGIVLAGWSADGGCMVVVWNTWDNLLWQ